MVITSKSTGTKYLTTQEVEMLKRKIKILLKRMGINSNISYHPGYLKVPVEDPER